MREWKIILSRDSESCNNLLCLNPNLHVLWTAGYFALKPLMQSEDGTQLYVEWHWLPRVRHGPHDHVPLATPQPSTEGLTGSGGVREIIVSTYGSINHIRLGQVFTIRTTDPETMPLPNFALLDMQFKLSQIVSLSSSVDEIELMSDYDDPSDDYLPYFDKKRVD